MSTGPVVRMVALPLDLAGSRAPLWWAVAMLAVIEVVGYATLFTAYLYLRFHTPVWPPEGFPRPSLLLGGAGVLVLLASAGAVRWGVAAIGRGDLTRLRSAFGSAAALAAIFLALQAAERVRAGFRWDENAYTSVVWTISLVHALHVATLLVVGGAVFLLAGRGFYTHERRLGVEVLALFWYVVALAWLPVFAVVYLVAW
jgi:cytochrome c oxidase subunit III